MGNEFAKPASNMGFTALAYTTPSIEHKEMDALHKELAKTCKAKESEMITKQELEDALKKAGKFDAPDLDVFSKLFILFDETGEGTVNYKDLLAGMYACFTTTPFDEKIPFALSIFDTLGSGNVLKGDLKRFLVAVNNIASYFGDPVLSLTDLENITLEAYKSGLTDTPGKGIPHAVCGQYLKENPLVLVFLRGGGKVRFGSPELNPV